MPRALFCGVKECGSLGDLTQSRLRTLVRPGDDDVTGAGGAIPDVAMGVVGAAAVDDAAGFAGKDDAAARAAWTAGVLVSVTWAATTIAVVTAITITIITTVAVIVAAIMIIAAITIMVMAVVVAAITRSWAVVATITGAWTWAGGIVRAAGGGDVAGGEEEGGRESEAEEGRFHGMDGRKDQWRFG